MNKNIVSNVKQFKTKLIGYRQEPLIFTNGFRLEFESQMYELYELKDRIDKAIEIIQNDTTLNPQRQRERLVETLRGKNE